MKKVFKAIFVISFMPYIVAILWATYIGISGSDSMFISFSTGFETFIGMLGYFVILLSPIFIFCILYQIVYLIITKVQKLEKK